MSERSTAMPEGTAAADTSRAAREADLVSCIIIFLDEERFLDEAVRSVVAQDHPHWELILVDDGSTDASPAIARRWADEHPHRIRAVSHPGRANAGMSASRNLGLSHARGAFIAFLDADDVWLPHKLAEQLALMRAHPEAGMVCGATQLWYTWDHMVAEAPVDGLLEPGAPFDQPGVPSPLRDVLVHPPTLATRLYPLGSGASPSTSNFLLRRTTVQAVGGYEPAFRAMYEDQAFQVKVYLRAPVFVSTRVWDRYRQHPASCSSEAQRRGEVWKARGRFLEWLEAYMLREGIAGPAVRRALEEARWPFRHPLRFALRRLAQRLRR